MYITAAKKEEVEAIEKEAKDKHEKEWEGKLTYLDFKVTMFTNQLQVHGKHFLLELCFGGGEVGDKHNRQIDAYFSWFFFMFCVETKTKILAERDRASADTAFKALDTDENGR